MAASNSTNFVLFGEKKLSDLFEEIYSNQRTKKQKIADLIEEFRKTIRHAGDIPEVGVVIKDLIKFSVDNDALLLQMATIAQRLIAAENKSPGDDGFLTQAEREQLLEELEQSTKQAETAPVKKIENFDDELEVIKNKLNKISNPNGGKISS
jgi:uncharacterized protein YfcZ (UPF0381/DUF406 family)